MKINKLRLKSAAKAMIWHFVGSLLVALIIGALVFGVWFPYPYRQLSGGTELFLLIMGVDSVCGPLLTLVLYNPAKSKRELILDLSFVVVMQLAALAYGVWTLNMSRPLYLVCEFDRFKVIALVDVELPELDKVPEILQRQIFKGPQIVGLRDGSKAEREKVLFESVQGGRDYGERPGFYVAYDGAKAYQKARPIGDFVKKHPDRQDDLHKLAGSSVAQVVNQLRYLPIIARQDWVAVLNPQGVIVGYFKGDGF